MRWLVVQAAAIIDPYLCTHGLYNPYYGKLRIA